MATQLDNETNQDDGYFQHTLPSYYRCVLKNFRKNARLFVHFNLLFLVLFTTELVCFFAFFPILSRSLLLALSLSALFVTGFSYLVLLFYFQARKPDELASIKEEFIRSCRRVISAPSGMAEHHLSIAEALLRLSSYLQDFEWEFYKVPVCKRALSKFSAYCYFEDVFLFKESLLLSAIDEHIQQIRTTPTDLEVHASLGGTYVTLSRLYRNPIQNSHHPRLGKLKKLQQLLEEKSDIYARLAIEEFTILSQYASDDPWVHEQMAMGYKDLGIPEEEIKEMELLASLRPQDKAILFRLGTLYFSQGMNAKGLKVYEELQKTNFKRAEDLIASYGAMS